MSVRTSPRRFGGRRASLAVLLSGTLVITACGGGDGSSLPQLLESTTTDAPPDTTEAADTTTTEPAPDTTEAPEPDTAPVGQAMSLEDAEAAVVQIVTDGTFRDPFEGELFFAGTGTGFIVDPEGLIVTNHHVV